MADEHLIGNLELNVSNVSVINVNELVKECNRLQKENKELIKQLNHTQNCSNQQYKQNLEHIQTIDELKCNNQELKIEIEKLRNENVELREKVESLNDEMINIRNERFIDKIVVACNDLTDELKEGSDENTIDLLNELGNDRNSKFGHYIRRNDKPHIVQYKKQTLYYILSNLKPEQLEILNDTSEPLYELLGTYIEHLRIQDYSNADETSKKDMDKCKRTFGLYMK